MVSLHFSICYLLNLFMIKLICWEKILRHGFYMKHIQNKIIFLVSYNLSSFNDMKFLALGVCRHHVTSAKMTLSPLQKFWHPFRFDLYGTEKTCANFDALVIIWTIIDLNSPTIIIWCLISTAWINTELLQ